ncbi:hypothetical protein BGW38_010803 [Lunasporangiospora selenospora]|uniref:Uncharacterized protein n=1 Tax=Lunasporangiospora selenospora TaxID=979761 RepID=A0A9P6FVQ8_9FUNG|nr:hypothetical protein BGW38_010803 [Lunasporangiospora selenospora]
MMENSTTYNANGRDQQQQQQQRLPDECLLVIIKEFESDIPMLYEFLTVSRFFFDEALKLLVGYPSETWSLLPSGREARKLRPKERFMALVLRSALQREWLKRQGITDQQGLQRIQDALKVQKASSATRDSIAPQSLQSLFPGTEYFSDLDSIMEEHGLELSYSSIIPRESFSQLTTVDYSAYIASLLTGDICRLNLGLLVKLRHPKEPGSLSEASPENEEDLDDGPFIRTARVLIRFLLQHGCQHVVDLGFDLRESAYYVQFATMMPKLRTIEIYMTQTSVHRHFQALEAARFIRLNREAFPSDYRLGFSFSAGHSVYSLPRYGEDGTDLQAWLRKRQMWKTHRYPLHLLYDAVRYPESIDASLTPFFYEESHSIETKNLKLFEDEDNDRWEAGEVPAMAAFLQRCHELQSLKVTVGYPHLFRWISDPPATMDQTDKSRVLKSQQRPLSKLSTLELCSNSEFWGYLQALNDVVAVSGESLEIIRAKSTVYGGMRDGDFPPEYQRTILLNDPFELQGIPRATTIGLEWYLPRVHTIELNFDGITTFGSFDQCPLLEKLTIDTRSSTLQLPGNPLSTQSDFEVVLPLLPVWKLPKLEQLVLRGTIAMQFDFESFRFMSNLQDLVLDMAHMDSIYFANSYMAICPTILRSVAVRDSAESTSPIQDSTDRFYPWNWASESVNSIVLEGYLANVFHLEQLAGFPSLDKLELRKPEQYYNSLLCTQTKALALLYDTQYLVQELFAYDSVPNFIPLSLSAVEPHPLSTVTEQTTNGSINLPESQGGDRDTVPETLDESWTLQSPQRSRLRQLVFTDRWESLCPDAWSQLLGRYAPHLELITGFKKLDPIKQIQNIEEAYRIMERVKSAQDGPNEDERKKSEEGSDADQDGHSSENNTPDSAPSIFRKRKRKNMCKDPQVYDLYSPRSNQ